MNKKIHLLFFLILILIVVGCSDVKTETSNLEEETLQPPTINDETLVPDDNLVGPNEFTASEEIKTHEELIVSTIEYATKATICVLNYQTIKTTTSSGGFWPSFTTTEEHKLYSMGSGVIYHKELRDDGKYLYKVITNAHVVSVEGDSSVVAGYGEYKIYDENYSEEILCELIGSDVDNDIAILYFFSSREYNAVTFADQSSVVAGKTVIAIGTPIDLRYYNTATSGIVSKIGNGYIQHDAALNSGNSGGPLFNIYGFLVGINNAKLSGNTSSGVSIEGIYFAIPLNMISESVIKITGVNDITYQE